MIRVKKSLNNSMLLVDHDQREMVLFGKGIGFNARPGALVDIAHIEQVFIPLETLKSRHFLSLTDSIPAAFFDVTHDIITLAQAHYPTPLHTVLFFTLAEHLFYAVERSKGGAPLTNRLSWEIKRYYPREYQLGEQARALVARRFCVALPEDEAVHIAFHLINASAQSENGDAHQQVQLVNRIAEIVRYKLKRDLNPTTLHYQRFITHLRYFAERIISRSIASTGGDDFYQELLRFYPQAMAVAWAIRDYIQDKYAVTLPKDELTWLSIHISRLAEEGSGD